MPLCPVAEHLGKLVSRMSVFHKYANSATGPKMTCWIYLMLGLTGSYRLSKNHYRNKIDQLKKSIPHTDASQLEHVKCERKQKQNNGNATTQG